MIHICANPSDSDLLDKLKQYLELSFDYTVELQGAVQNKFYEFLKKEEHEFVSLLGEKEWKLNKVYFVDEIVEFVKKYELEKKE